MLLGGEEYARPRRSCACRRSRCSASSSARCWTLGLVSLRRQRDVAVANAFALARVIVLGLVLVQRVRGDRRGRRCGRDRGRARAAPPRGSSPVPTATSRPGSASCRGRSPPARGALVALLPCSPWIVAPLAAAALPRRRVRARRGSARGRARAARAEAASEPAARPRPARPQREPVGPAALGAAARRVRRLACSSPARTATTSRISRCRSSAARRVRDRLPGGRIGELASRVPGDRYLDLERHLRRRGHRPLGRARRLVQRPARRD